jgi:hypothetical protein
MVNIPADHSQKIAAELAVTALGLSAFPHGHPWHFSN